MPFRFGSDRSSTNQNLSSTLDALGNPIISADLSFGASPLGEAARTQVALGVPNGTFNLLPNDPSAEIDSSNPIPYWSWEASGSVIATMDFDDTTQTWSVVLDPNSAGSGDYGILKTRIPIVNDEGLDIRHFVSSSLIQGIKPASPTAWTMDLTAQYIDTTGAAIGTAYTIGTLTQSGTATNLSSYTNASGPIDTTAAELEIAYTITRGATGLSDVVAIIKSVLVATDYGAIGGGGGGGDYIPLSVITAAGDLIKGAALGSATRIAQGTKDQVLTVLGTALGSVGWATPPAPYLRFQAQVFTESDDFVVPDYVTHVTIIGMGGGQGGAAGAGTATSASFAAAAFGSGGATGAFVVAPDVFVGDQSVISVGIGAGGVGGSSTTVTKAAAATAVAGVASVAGAAGGPTTFGSYLSIGGGGGTTVTRLVYGVEITPGAAGGIVAGGNSHAVSAFTQGFPGYNYLTFVSPGNAGSGGASTGATTSATGSGGTANGTAGFGGGGGGSGSATANGTTLTATSGITGGAGGAGAGGGGAVARIAALNLTVTVDGGAGGSAIPNSASGGGGGGAVAVNANSSTNYNSAAITLKTGKAGDGGSGFLAVTWYEVFNP